MTQKHEPEIPVSPITLAPISETKRGRKPKLVAPPLPAMPGMNEDEALLFDFFQEAIKAQYPDLTQFDLLILHLAAVEYIKYLRVAARELETKQVISMARQHPGVNMRALLDQLSVTRKARTGNTKDTGDDLDKEARAALLGLSRR